jgi:hypothetical protein
MKQLILSSFLFLLSIVVFSQSKDSVSKKSDSLEKRYIANLSESQILNLYQFIMSSDDFSQKGKENFWKQFLSQFQVIGVPIRKK